MIWIKANEKLWKYWDEVAYKVNGSFQGFAKHHNITFMYDLEDIEWMLKSDYESNVQKLHTPIKPPKSAE